MKNEIRERRKRFLAMLLTLMMVVGLLPTLGVKATDYNVGGDSSPYGINTYLNAGAGEGADKLIKGNNGDDDISITYYDLDGLAHGDAQPVAADGKIRSYGSGEGLSFTTNGYVPLLDANHISNRWKLIGDVSSEFKGTGNTVKNYSLVLKALPRYRIIWKKDGVNVFEEDNNVTGFIENDNAIPFLDWAFFENREMYETIGVDPQDAPPAWKIGWKTDKNTSKTIYSGTKQTPDTINIDNISGFDADDNLGSDYDVYFNFVWYTDVKLFYNKVAPGSVLLADAPESYIYGVEKDSTITVPEGKPTNFDGYAFVAWCTDQAGTEEWDFTKPVTNPNMELYAKWIKKYTVKFDKAGGTFTGSTNDYTFTGLQDTYTSADGKFNIAAYTGTPSKEGYVFAGWKIGNQVYTEIPYANAAALANATDSTITLTAAWKKKYSVTYKYRIGNGTLTSVTNTFVEGTAATDTLPELPALVEDVYGTYTLVGWKEVGGDNTLGTNELPPVGKDVVYEAVYTKVDKYYDVKFLSEDGSVVLKDKVSVQAGTLGTDLVQPAETPKKDPTVDKVFTFKGWKDKDTQVEYGVNELPTVLKNTDYLATFNSEDRQYSVSFVDENGTTVLKAAANYNYNTTGANIAKPDEPAKAATVDKTFTFAGWSDGTNTYKTSELPSVVKDVVYKATYASKTRQYSVSFVDEDGTTVLKAAANYDYNTPAADIARPKDPVRNADADYTYTFAGWAPNIADVTRDRIYVATYNRTPKSTGNNDDNNNNNIIYYTVTFKDNDGTVLKAATTYAAGTTVNRISKPPVPATKEDDFAVYTFTGWSPKMEPVTKDVVYTATYKKTETKFYYIKFVDEDGKTTLYQRSRYKYNTKVSQIKQPQTPTKASDDEFDYIFSGWTPALEPVTKDQTYTATYKAIPKDQGDKDFEGSSFGPLFGRISKTTATSITIEFAKLDGIDGYDIYGAPCNTSEEKFSYQYIKTLKKNKTHIKIKELEQHRYYKFFIEAFKMVNGEKVIVARSVLMHGNTTGEIYGTATEITVDQTEITLHLGKGLSKKQRQAIDRCLVTATETNTEVTEKSPDGKKIRLHRPICFESTDKSIAYIRRKGKRIDTQAAPSLSCSGTIVAKDVGTCKILVYAQNGLSTEITVHVVE